MVYSSTVNTTRDVLKYIGQYQGHLFVIRIDDQLLKTPLFSMFIKDVVLLHRLGIQIVLVPSARLSIDSFINAKQNPNNNSSFVTISTPYGLTNRRITSECSLDSIIQGTTSVVNKLLSLLTENGAQGVVGNWVRARTLGVINGTDFQRTGSVERIDSNLISSLLKTDTIPIVSNLGWNSIGQLYNISSIELAVAVAISLKATKLLFVETKSGIQKTPTINAKIPTRETGIYSSIDLRHAKQLLNNSKETLTSDEHALISSAINACSAGVERVHIINGNRDGILIDEVFSADGVGTMFYTDQYIEINKSTSPDIAEIMRLIQPQIDLNLLIPQTSLQVAENLEKFYVYKIDETVQGCAALNQLNKDYAEIESLVVSESHRGHGHGARLVNHLKKESLKLRVKRLLVMTTQSVDFFLELGFSQMSLDEIPPERPRDYDQTRNSRILMLEI